MGPRTKRRLAWLAATVVALAVVVGAFQHFSVSRGSGNSGGSATHRRLEVGAQSGRIAYGATPRQVLTTLGAPTKKQGACWSYSAKAHTINGEYLGDVVDGLRYCFSDGPTGGKVVANIYEHIIAHRLPTKKWYPGGWNPAMTLMGPHPPPP